MTIQGLSGLTKQLSGLRSMTITSRQAAELILKKAQERVVVRTGFLRDSGRVNETDKGSEVEFTAPYAVPIEFGTSKMAAQPFLRPATDENQAEIIKAEAEEIQKEINKVI